MSETESKPETATQQETGGDCNPRLVLLLRLYAPKRKHEMMLFKQDWQVDPIPREGIWETIAVEQMDTDPLWSMKCFAGWGAAKSGDVCKIRERLIVALFERVEIVRHSLEQNV